MPGLLVTLIWFPLLGAAMCRLAGGRSWFLMGIGVCGFALFAGGLFGLAPVTMLIALAIAAIAVVVVVPWSIPRKYARGVMALRGALASLCGPRSLALSP